MSIGDLSEREFAKVEEAKRFYCNYALAIGFSIRRSRLRRSEGGVVMGRQWVCSKEGSRSKKWTNRDDMVRTPRKETRENCHATFAVKYCPNQDAYIVTKFVKEHSHRLANSHEVPFLRSHRCVTESNIAQSMSMRKASIKTNRTYDYMVDQAGGYKKVGFTSKDLYNRMDFERRQVVLDGDAQAAISYMNGKAIADPKFFCMFSVDEENRLANLFWRDSQSLHDYCCFGDVVILDSTYKTNVYDKPLVVFVGVNNHNATTVFGCAFLVDETADTYRWVLRTFLTSMKDKKPVSIVTDWDDAMRVAIDEVFPDAHHRLCTWHIMRNVNTNVNTPEIVREFSYCVHGGLTPVAFEQHWQQMIDTYDLKGDWIEMMYHKRKRWAEAYCSGHFFGGNTTTQRVEGMHKNLKDGIGRGMRLVEGIPRIERSLLRLRNENVKDDFDSNNSHPLLRTHLRSLEEHAASIFTHDIYKLIRNEINKEAKLILVQPVRNNEDPRVYTFSKFGRPVEKWTVVYYTKEQHLQCSCKLFESSGIPCCHMFGVMKCEHMDEILPTLIMKRWTKDARRGSEIVVKSDDVPHETIQMARFGSLSVDFNKLCFYGSQTEVAYKRLKAECGRLNTLVETWKEQHEQTSLKLGCHNNVVRDPIVAKTKGKQTTGSKGKKAPQCGECKVTGHNKRNCPNLIVGEGGKRKRGYTSDMSDILSSFGPEDDTTVGNKTFYSSSSAVHGTKMLSSSYTPPNSGFSCGEVSSGSTHYTSDGFTFDTPEYSVLESQFDTQASPRRDRNRF
ncbi:protein FAR1-RELATED SEQUENCE 5-like [Prunus dulcis]|uniref:protein FAR1-RELATED SEQUENCE 5-like n=1 Tax=Prunus dulcis TaxID=3755 RepID=UPI001483BC1D|nr:protein FAR1-RELATED SEQUENCE 5-like [Prunus dulcis]